MGTVHPVPLHRIAHIDGRNRGIAGIAGNIRKENIAGIDELGGCGGGHCRQAHHCQQENQLAQPQRQQTHKESPRET